MTAHDTFGPPPATVPRDGWGRPLILPPGGGKPRAYTRVTTLVDVMTERTQLEKWKCRSTALGLTLRPDLLLAVTAHSDDKRALNKIVDQAMEAAQASAAATTGTALHAITDRIDRGQPVGPIPAAHQADVAAYRAKTACLDVVEIEQFVVLDDLEVAGTRDRVVFYKGRYYIADTKTGSIDWGGLKNAQQLATYAHGVPYHAATGQRTPTSYQVDTRWALIIHLPAGQGHCQLHWMPIDVGWQALQDSLRVRGWRARKDWYRPFDTFDPYPDDQSTVDMLAERITAASTVDALRQLWVGAIADGTWTPAHTEIAVARKAHLEGTSA